MVEKAARRAYPAFSRLNQHVLQSVLYCSTASPRARVARFSTPSLPTALIPTTLISIIIHHRTHTLLHHDNFPHVTERPPHDEMAMDTVSVAHRPGGTGSCR